MWRGVLYVTDINPHNVGYGLWLSLTTTIQNTNHPKSFLDSPWTLVWDSKVPIELRYFHCPLDFRNDRPFYFWWINVTGRITVTITKAEIFCNSWNHNVWMFHRVIYQNLKKLERQRGSGWTNNIHQRHSSYKRIQSFLSNKTLIESYG